jgi:TolA-binding protein
MMAGVTEAHLFDDEVPEHGRHEAAPSGSSIVRLIQRIQSQHQMIGDLVATESEQIQRLKDDVGGYVSAMRTKVTSLQDQIASLGGQVSTAKADQMTADADELSQTLDTLEQAFAQDNPPPAPSPAPAPATPGTDPTGGGTPPATDPTGAPIAAPPSVDPTGGTTPPAP